jgi:hypothetical protein
MLTKLHTIVVAAWLAAGACGCQCCCVTEYWNDLVDCTANIEPSLECLYVPCLDLTRINRVGGIQCQCHRCQTCYIPADPYVHLWADPKTDAEVAPQPAGDPALPLETVPGLLPETNPYLPPEPTPALPLEPPPVAPPVAPPADPFAPTPAAATGGRQPSLDFGPLPIITPAEISARQAAATGALPPLALPLFYE